MTKLLTMFPGRKFVEESMGTKYVDTARLEFEKLFEDCGPSTPVFFILSPGVDPLRDVEKLGTMYIPHWLQIMYYLFLNIPNILCLQD